MCDCATDNVFYTSIDIKNNALTFQSVYENIKNELNEKQRRLLLGAYANKLGRGGVSILSKLTGVRGCILTAGNFMVNSGSLFVFGQKHLFLSVLTR